MCQAIILDDDDDYLDGWVPLPPTNDPRDRFSEDEIAEYNKYYDRVAQQLLPANTVRVENRPYTLIAAARGDDFAAVVTNDEYGIAYLWGMEEQSLKVSWKDVNISKNSLFYAESVILLPPCARMHWEYTLRREKSHDIPFLLDPVYLKSLTPVRKQSNIETDLPSKMRLLSTRARWCHPQGVAYDFHQHAILCGLAIFDMEGSFQFPFLFEQNGGCGGAPPYQNPATGLSALFHHRRGGTKKAILGIMRESVAVNSCQLDVRDAIFLPWVYQAQSGDSDWLSAIDAVRQAEGLGYSDTEILEIIKSGGRQPFPEELQHRVITIPVRNPIVGTTISRMRRNGILYTKLDVQERLANRKVLEAYYGETQMGKVARDIDSLKRAARTNSLQMLKEMLELKPSLKSQALDTIPDTREEQIKIMSDYYRDFDDGNSALSSLCYGKEVEVIHAPVVENFLGDGSAKILRQTIGIGMESTYSQIYANSMAKIENLSAAEAWLRDMERDIYSMPPVGFGARDADILVGISEAMKIHKQLAIVIVSSDKGLINNARKWTYFSKNMKDVITQTAPAVIQISSQTLICQAFINGHLAPSGKTMNLTHPQTMEPFPMTKSLFQKILQSSGSGKRKTFPWLVFYDEPNIAKFFARTTIRNKRLWVQNSGGISASVARQHPSWQEWPFDCLARSPAVVHRESERHFGIRFYADQNSVVSSKASWDSLSV